MAAIPQLRSLSASAIDAGCLARQEVDPTDHPTLRCSQVGEECDRRLWYGLRWALHPVRPEPRIQRIFDNGHDREARIVGYLRAAGIDIQDRDPETGAQWRVSLADGMLTGSVDGIATGVPEAPVARHLLEIKTMNSKRWKAWRAKGVAVSDPKYYVQMQLYMRGLGLDRALFVAECQDTKEIEVERVRHDPLASAAMEARAMRIALALDPPDRIGGPDDFRCRFCPAKAICHDGADARRNCRTCIAFRPTGWHCERDDRSLPLPSQPDGCGLHLYIPGLVAAEQVDADHDAGTVTYRRPDGSLWVDGPRPL